MEMNYFCVIPSFIMESVAISSTEKLFYAVVSGLMSERGYCYADNAYLSKILGIKERQIRNCIANLMALGLMNCENDRNSIRLLSCSFDGSRQKIAELGSRQKIAVKSAKNCRVSCNIINNIYNKKNIIKRDFLNDSEKTEDSKKVGVNDMEVVLRIYDLYPRKIAKSVAIKAIERSLRSYSEEFLSQRVIKFSLLCRREMREVKFVPHCATWFNQERFLDEDLSNLSVDKKYSL